jgi:hypothetical protein
MSTQPYSTVRPSTTQKPLSHSYLGKVLTSNPVATLPEDELPLPPTITPGWGIAGTILLATGLTHLLVGVRAKRVQTFFSTAFLAALGTIVLILYLMTPPVSHAVQGGFVVAGVCTGAALGGLAMLFKDLAECLGCLLGGFCLSMWMLTLHPGGLVANASAKVVFIAVFACAGFCLYFSRWTRGYGLMVSISFGGATAAVLGIDCFSRAGLKEFWAYIWALNAGLFPAGAVSYPLTRGIRVELALTVILAVLGFISQLKLWRLIHDRRNKGKEESSDEEVALPDEEENIGRRVEEMAARERREWERVYGNGGSGGDGSPDGAVGDMESEKRQGHSKRSSATSTTEVQSPVESPEGELPASESPREQLEKDAGDCRVTVRVAEDDIPEEDTADNTVQEKGEDGSHEVTCDPATSHSPESGRAPAIVPLPFKIPKPRTHDAQSSVAAVAEEEDRSTVVAVAEDDDRPSVANVAEEDRSSVAAVADEEDQPNISTQGANPESVPRMWRNSMSLRGNLPRHPAGSEVENDEVVGRGYQEMGLPTEPTRDSTASVMATLDDESTSGDADTAVLDWPPSPKESVRDSFEAEKEPVTETEQDGILPDAPDVPDTPDTSDTPAGDVRDNSVDTSAPGEADQLTTINPPSPTPHEPSTEAEEAAENKQGEVATARSEPADAAGGPALTASGSAESVRTTITRLTKPNLPPALPDIALTYRTNEWAKHLSLAETPEPEALLLSEPIPDTPDEAPAHLDIVDLQQTAMNAAPPPAAPRAASAMSYDPPHPATSISRASRPASGIRDFAPSALSGSQSESRPAPYRTTSMIMQRQSSTVLAQPIAEEDGEPRRISGVQQSETAHTAQPASNHRRSASQSTPDLTIHASGTHPYSRPQTLIGMREMLLRSRASGIFAPDPAITTTTTRHAPSDAGSIRNYRSPQPHFSSSTNLDLDDLPLSQRRSILRQSSSLQPTPQPTAESTPFNSHQPTRHSPAPPEAVRQAQLAQFRSSVAADLRVASPAPGYDSNKLRRMSSSATALLNIGAGLGMGPSASMVSLESTSTSTMGGGAGAVPGVGGGLVPPGGVVYGGGGVYLGFGGAASGGEQKGDVLRSMELQRSILLGQTEMEVRRKEAELVEKQGYEREFEERMRSGLLMGAHRDAMRRLQGGVKG